MDGADIIDLGAASSRPGATLPSPEEVLVLSRVQKGLVLVTGSAGAGAFVQPLNSPVPSRDITAINVIDFLKDFINISVSI